MGDERRVVDGAVANDTVMGLKGGVVHFVQHPNCNSCCSACRAIPCLQQFPIPGHPRGLTLFDVSGHNEIYPGSKLAHFKAIHKRSGIDYEDMLFFDNERWVPGCCDGAIATALCISSCHTLLSAAPQQHRSRGHATFRHQEMGGLPAAVLPC
jgi:hypothetical protein